MTDTEQHPMMLGLSNLFDKARANFDSYKALKGQVDAANGDRDAAVKAYMETSDDPEMKAIREAMERAQAKLRELAEVSVPDSNVTPEEKAKLEAELETVEKKAKASSKSLRKLVDDFDIPAELMTAKLKEIGDPFLPKAQTSQPGQGSGTPRPSVWVSVKNLSNGQTWNFDSLSSSAKLLGDQGLDTKAIAELYAEAAGTNYEEISKISQVVTFTWQNPALPNASEYELTITPKEGSKRGRQAVTAPVTDEEQSEQASQDEENVA